MPMSLITLWNKIIILFFAKKQLTQCIYLIDFYRIRLQNCGLSDERTHSTGTTTVPLYTTIFYTSQISVYDDAPLDDRDRVGRP